MEKVSLISISVDNPGTYSQREEKLHWYISRQEYYDDSKHADLLDHEQIVDVSKGCQTA